MILSLINNFPQAFASLPVLVASLTTLSGLVLWAAGIRVARAMVACLFGIIFAALSLWLLPAAFALSDIPSALIGMIAGVFIGIVAFRFLQGVVLALCLGAVVCGGYYHIQTQAEAEMNGTPRAAAPQSPTLPVAIHESVAKAPASPSLLPADLDSLKSPDLHSLDAQQGALIAQNVAGTIAQKAAARWQNVPTPLRQRIIILGLAVAAASITLAWMLPKHITWLMTAFLGSSLLIYGSLALLQLFAPPFQQWVPPLLWQRMLAAAIIVLIGLTLQRLLFWPGKKSAQSAPTPSGRPAMG